MGLGSMVIGYHWGAPNTHRIFNLRWAMHVHMVREHVHCSNHFGTGIGHRLYVERTLLYLDVEGFALMHS